MPRILLFLSLLFTSCYAPQGMRVLKPKATANLWADGHVVILDSTKHFRVTFYVPPMKAGRKSDIKVKVENVSDTILTTFPEQFSLTYYDSEREMVISNFARNPLAAQEEGYTLINRELSARENEYSASTAGVGIGATAIAVLLGDDTPEEEATAISESYREMRYAKSGPRISHLYEELQRIEKFWLQRNSLFPNEYVEGTVQLYIPNWFSRLKLNFSDGRERIEIPIGTGRM